MYLFILAAAALALAAVLWYAQASGREAEAARTQAAEELPELRLRRTLEEDPSMAETLAEAVRAMEELMAHPELGGPGFLLVRFPPLEDGWTSVTVQYPNTREGLYRRIVRQELDREELAAAGMPAAVLDLDPSFETESGGVVMASVEVSGIPEAFVECLNSRRARSAGLEVLAQALRPRLPGLSIRSLGADLLLLPVRENTESSAATSTDG